MVASRQKPLTFSPSGIPRDRSRNSSNCCEANGVRQLIDIRTIPKSRRNPQFNTEALAASLAAAGIDYVHMKALGGLRHPRRIRRISAGATQAFAAMRTTCRRRNSTRRSSAPFGSAGEKPTALMCAEAVPWRCHRSLVPTRFSLAASRCWRSSASAAPKAAQTHAVRARRGHARYLSEGRRRATVTDRRSRSSRS